MKKYLALLALLLACCIESPTQVALIKLTPPSMITSLEARTVDGVVVWEPWASLAVQRGVAEYRLNSSDIWEGHPCCVVAADSEWSEENDEILTRFIAAHIAAINWINSALESDNSKLYAYAEQLTGHNRSVVEPAIKNMEFSYEMDAHGITEVGEDFMDFELFDQGKWEESGYASISSYVDSLLVYDLIEKTTEETAEEVPFWQLLCPPLRPQTPREKVPVRVGYIRGDLHHLPLFVAVGEGFLERADILPIMQGFDNGPQIMVEGFKMNTIDVAYLGIAPALIYGINANDGDLNINVISGVNYEGSAFITRKGAETIKTIATPGPGSVQYFLALKVIDGFLEDDA